LPTLHSAPAQHCLTVEDTGSGIAAEHLPHLFERFYRVDAARSREAGGSGLGLAIAHSIVTAHGGSIEVKSDVGQGTIVTVTLPTLLSSSD
jgi:signal transduction histidine kinase